MFKRSILMAFIFCFCLSGINAHAQTDLSLYKTTTLFSGLKSDTAYSTSYRLSPDVNKYICYLNVDIASSADSLHIKLYGSADNEKWHEITRQFTTVTAASQQRVVVTNFDFMNLSAEGGLSNFENFITLQTLWLH